MLSLEISHNSEIGLLLTVIVNLCYLYSPIYTYNILMPQAIDFHAVFRLLVVLLFL